jgi:hypothetical protein
MDGRSTKQVLLHRQVDGELLEHARGRRRDLRPDAVAW